MELDCWITYLSFSIYGEIKMAKRYVYGTRTNRWHLVDESDRDYEYGFTPAEFKRLGKAEAKEKYLAARILR